MNGSQISLILCLVAQFIDQVCFRPGQMLLGLDPQSRDGRGQGLAGGHFLQQTPGPLFCLLFSLSCSPFSPTRTKRADAGPGPLTPTQTYGSDLLCLCNYTGACFSMAPGFIAHKPTYSYIKHFYSFSSRGSMARTCRVQQRAGPPRQPAEPTGRSGTPGSPGSSTRPAAAREAEGERLRCGVAVDRGEPDPPVKTTSFQKAAEDTK